MVALAITMTILVFLTIDLFVQRKQQRRAAAAAVPDPENPLRRPALEGASIAASPPAGAWLDSSHVWIRQEAIGCVRVGVDGFPAGLLGSPESVELLPGGTEVTRGDPLVTLRKGNRSLTLPAPFDGSILSFNIEAKWAPELLGRDSFGGGWLYLIWPRSDCDTTELRAGAEATGWIRDELGRLREHVTQLLPQGGLVGATLQDGGPPLGGIASHLDPDRWDQLAAAFFSTRTNGEPPSARGTADVSSGGARCAAG